MWRTPLCSQTASGRWHRSIPPENNPHTPKLNLQPPFHWPLSNQGRHPSRLEADWQTSSWGAPNFSRGGSVSSEQSPSSQTPSSFSKREPSLLSISRLCLTTNKKHFCPSTYRLLLPQRDDGSTFTVFKSTDVTLGYRCHGNSCAARALPVSEPPPVNPDLTPPPFFQPYRQVYTLTVWTLKKKLKKQHREVKGYSFDEIMSLTYNHLLTLTNQCFKKGVKVKILCWNITLVKVAHVTGNWVIILKVKVTFWQVPKIQVNPVYYGLTVTQ